MSTPVTLDDAKAAVRAAAWDEGAPCPTCVDGKMPTGGRMLIHAWVDRVGSHWELSAVLDLIDRAERIAWIDSLTHHDLVIVAGGHAVELEVSSPTRQSGALR